MRQRIKQLKLPYVDRKGFTHDFNGDTGQYEKGPNPFETRGRGPAPGRVLTDIKILARRYTQEALEMTVEIMRGGETEGVRLEAVKIIMDRAYGKPKQDVSVEVRRSMEDYTDAELMALGGKEIEEINGRYAGELHADLVGVGSEEEGSAAFDGEILSP